MRDLQPGDEITVEMPLGTTTKKLRGVFLRYDDNGDVRFYTFDSANGKQRAGFRAARPEWVTTKHRKHLYPTPALLNLAR